jgi:hypothetical protein
MCETTITKKPSLELADIFLQHAQSYIEKHGVSVAQNKAIKAVSQCRTAALGGHVSRCNHCGVVEISYNSCRYRHCPKCQTMKQLRWLEARKAEILPVPYYHVVFTIPHELNGLASYNAPLIYNLLFQSAWSTLNTLGHDPKRLNGQMGMLAFLHTWGQNLSQHIHLHCLIPGGAITENEHQEKKWNAAGGKYLFPKRVLSALFRPIFIQGLKKAYKNNQIVFKGAGTPDANSVQFKKLIQLLYKKSWNVYAKAPFNGAKGGLEYLARYVSKTAISNHRLMSCEEGKVTFKWKDYADHSKEKLMVLDAHEFIRRYLSHVLPDGFMRVRSFGFLANACKTKNIALIRSLIAPQLPTTEIKMIPLESPPVQPTKNSTTRSSSEKVSELLVKESAVELIQRLIGIDVGLCKCCKVGRLEIIEALPSQKVVCASYWDSS